MCGWPSVPWLFTCLCARCLPGPTSCSNPCKENRERLRQAAAVFDCTREGVLVTDASGLIVHVNRAFMEITGYQREDVMGQQPSLFKSGRHSSNFYQQMFQTLDAPVNGAEKSGTGAKAARFIHSGKPSG